MDTRQLVTRFFTNRLPLGAVAYFRIADALADALSDDSITLSTGTPENLMEATWAFPATAVMLQADIDEGGDVLFDSANGMSPFVRSGADWYELLNKTFVWVGPHLSRGGVVVYTVDKSGIAGRIQRFLGRYTATVFGPTWAEPGTWNDDLTWSES